MVITMYIKRNELVVVAFECWESIRINAFVPKLFRLPAVLSFFMEWRIVPLEFIRTSLFNNCNNNLIINKSIVLL